MDGDARQFGSEYLRWAKTHPPAKYDLTSSGLPFLKLKNLPVKLRRLELSGSGGYGHPPLIEAIAERYRVPRESVVTAMGTSMGNHLVMSALLRPGDEVLIEFPAYDPLPSLARQLGIGVRYFPRRAEDGFRIDPHAVARAITNRTRLIVITNLHNPSGALTDDDTLLHVGDLARRAGARVLVDEVYLDALFEAQPRTAFHLGDTFIVTSSLTKVYGLNGLRCGWVFAEPALAERMWRLVELYIGHGAMPAELLGLAALKHLDGIAARSRKLLRRNGDALNAFYQGRDDLEWMPYEHGTVSFPRLRSGAAATLCRLLETKYDTAVVDGAFFGMPQHFRIALGTKPKRFAAGLERLGAALDELRGDPLPSTTDAAPVSDATPENDAAPVVDQRVAELFPAA
ncbi:MAG TPA: pyridoxal phosphate-dependent aminotransferase [Longimicrobium sp.]|nr:pyridoxal phosphate-dependent aminotransferase [Longimicrobium sp.]